MVRRKIRMCGVRLRDRVGVVVKIENIIQSRLWWYGRVMRGDISSQIREVMKAEITGKRKKDRQRESWEVFKGFQTIWLEKTGCVRSAEIAKAN